MNGSWSLSKNGRTAGLPDEVQAYQRLELDDERRTIEIDSTIDVNRLSTLDRVRQVTPITLVITTICLGAIYVSTTGAPPVVAFSEQDYTKRNTYTPYIRKEVRELSYEERERYYKALKVYKYEGRKDGKPYLTTYDQAVVQHGIAAMNTTYSQNHYRAAFLVWHSMLVYEIEQGLRSIDPDVVIPYWDWTLDSEEDTGVPLADSPIFSADYFGSSLGYEDNYLVNDSFVADWEVPLTANSDVWWTTATEYLRGGDGEDFSALNYLSTRTIARRPGGFFGGYAQWRECLNGDKYHTYGNFWPCVWGTFDLANYTSLNHALIHQKVGGIWSDVTNNGTAYGDFYDLITSVNDPLWLSYHAGVDRLFYIWRNQTGFRVVTEDDPCGGYYDSVMDVARYPQPPGHNYGDHFDPPFYATNTDKFKVDPNAAITVKQACELLLNENSPYGYNVPDLSELDKERGYVPSWLQ